jgi:hypothetical protein
MESKGLPGVLLLRGGRRSLEWLVVVENAQPMVTLHTIMTKFCESLYLAEYWWLLHALAAK